jgi:ATP-binding cassette subfamily B protein
VRLVKTSATEDYETDRLKKSSLDYYRANMSVLRISYFYRPGMELLAGASFAATFLVGGYWVVAGPPPYMSGTLTVGEFVIFIVMIRRFVEPLASVSDTVDQYENAKASAERVFGLMDISSDVHDAPDAVELDDVEGHVEYDGVSFSYAGNDERVLEKVSLNVQPGETVALVGPTGAGKSTVVKLLTRMYDVDEGTVRLDGRDVRDVTKESLRRCVGYVSQDPFLFDGTVDDNIRYGAFDASDEEMREAARAAEAHGFIEKLPDGYETRVGERGVKLSGGQRQRLAIARAIVRDPSILILDEATSDVDTETEMLIQRSLDGLTADRTTFVVAHRLSTVKDADEIVVLEGGQIIERGKHDYLVAQGGLYADLWRIQTGDADAQLP